MEEVNLDLNLSPDPEVSLEPGTSNASTGLSDVANEPFNRDSEPRRRFRTWHGSRFLRLVNSSSALQASGERVKEDSKKCENGNKVMKQDNVNEEKSVGSEGSFYDCYICMDLCKDPVVTSCGHLYCWSCLYRWLEVSEAKECPVCKGEVSVKTLTPIYGRGKNNNKGGSEEVNSDTNKIPSRPPARRVESLRSRLQRPGYIGREIIMTSRAEQNQSNAAVFAPVSVEERERFWATFLMMPHIPERNQERNNIAGVGVEDRDSVSSIIGVMNSETESHQVDTAAEIDSMVTVSSYVGRPHENGSRVSDVDSADSRPVRRRRTTRRLA